jgi:hypothetical protein
MSYTDTAALTSNYEFQQRVTAASTEQALIFVNDARPEFVAPATAVILSASNAQPFVNLVAGQPGITEAATDGDILAALQAVWPKYGAALTGGEA